MMSGTCQLIMAPINHSPSTPTPRQARLHAYRDRISITRWLRLINVSPPTTDPSHRSTVTSCSYIHGYHAVIDSQCRPPPPPPPLSLGKYAPSERALVSYAINNFSGYTFASWSFLPGWTCDRYLFLLLQSFALIWTLTIIKPFHYARQKSSSHGAEHRIV